MVSHLGTSMIIIVATLLLVISHVTSLNGASDGLSPQQALSLSDHRIVGSSFTSLNGVWDLSSPQQALYLQGTVPGDLLTDLQRAYVIANPLYENNFKNGAVWNDYTWVYTKLFTLSADDISRLSAPTTDLLLVFDGIKLGADILVNGRQLDTAINQFMRYEYALGSLHRNSSLLLAGDNNVTLVFDPSIDVRGMFMACTGGWDWVIPRRND